VFIVQKKFAQAYEKFVEITKLDIVPELKQYHELILLMGMIGVADVELVLEEMRRREVAVGIETMNEVIKVYGRRRDSEGIYATLKRIDESGLKTNGNTFWAMVEAFVKANDVDGAKFAIDEMKRRKISGDQGSFYARMRYYSFVGNVDGVEDAFFEMTEQYGFFPDVYAYNLRIASFAAKKEVFAVKQTLEEMKKIAKLKPNEMTFNILIKMYVSMNDQESATAAFQQMKELKLRPGQLTFEQLMQGMRKQEEKELIESAITAMRRVRRQPVAFCNLFDSLTQTFTDNGSERSRAVVKALQKMLTYDLNPTHNLYLHAFPASAADGDKLRNPESVVASLTENDFEVDQFMLCCIFDAYHRLLQPHYAMDLLTYMEHQGLKPSAGMISVVVGSYCRRNKPMVALCWLHHIATSGVRPTARAFAYLTCYFSQRLQSQNVRATVALLERINMGHHSRLDQCLINARNSREGFCEDIFVNRQTDDLPVDRHSMFEFSQNIKKQVPFRSLIRETTAARDEPEIDSNTGGAILEQILAQEQLDLKQHLILQKLTQLALETVRSDAKSS